MHTYIHTYVCMRLEFLFVHCIIDIMYESMLMALTGLLKA